MDRRHFLTTTVLAGSAVALGRYDKVFAAPPPGALPYDLVALKGGEPAAMFDKGIDALGGMKAFVKKGQKVLVKPNIGWDVTPERAGNTNPQLVSRIIQQCYAAGAKEVVVFDHTCDDWKRSYRNSGIESAVRDAGAKIAPGNAEGNYQEVSIKGGSKLQSSKVHELLLEADVFINVPVLKHHSSAKLTIGMKNLMGVVWDRGFWHANDLHQCIADFAAYRKPDLTIVDAYNVMKRNGPRGVSEADVVAMKAQLITTDVVAADVAGAKLYGADISDVRYIQLAADRKLGRTDLDKMNIKRISM